MLASTFLASNLHCSNLKSPTTVSCKTSFLPRSTAANHDMASSHAVSCSAVSTFVVHAVHWDVRVESNFHACEMKSSCTSRIRPWKERLSNFEVIASSSRLLTQGILRYSTTSASRMATTSLKTIQSGGQWSPRQDKPRAPWETNDHCSDTRKDRSLSKNKNPFNSNSYCDHADAISWRFLHVCKHEQYSHLFHLKSFPHHILSFICKSHHSYYLPWRTSLFYLKNWWKPNRHPSFPFSQVELTRECYWDDNGRKTCNYFTSWSSANQWTSLLSLDCYWDAEQH